jgi:hypothetical protein
MQTTQLESHENFQLLRPEQVNILSAAAEEISFHGGDAVFLRGEKADDLVMGYAVQTMISRACFKRCIDTMRKLQRTVQSIPLEAVWT